MSLNEIYVSLKLIEVCCCLDILFNINMFSNTACDFLAIPDRQFSSMYILRSIIPARIQLQAVMSSFREQ